MFQIKSDNTTKIGENIKLYFSTDPSIKFNDYKADNNDIARLTIKINYAQAKVITRPIINDNSKLNKVLQTNTIKLSKEIKDELAKQCYKIEKSSIELTNNISSLGFHNVNINLYPEITAQIKVHVIK